jgi:hypothetical protein
MPAPVQGERVCAYIELKEAVESFTKKVARYKWPDRVELIKGLPRTPTGKVIKNVLRKQIAEKLKAEAAKYSASRSKRRLIHEALATFVAVKAEERRRATYRERLERVRGRTAGLHLKSDLHDLVRTDRDSR